MQREFQRTCRKIGLFLDLKSCIEIHHIKPIYQYEDDDENKTLEAALRNLMPVCPNCHRIIHKNKIGASDMPMFKQSILQTYCAR